MLGRLGYHGVEIGEDTIIHLPEHRSLYLCYIDAATLPRIALAIGKAYTNEVSLVKTGIAGLRHKDKKA